MLSKIVIPHKTLFRVSDSLDAQGQKIPTITGILSESEVVSPNGYRYRKDFWPAVLSQPYVKEMISSRSCLGCIEHPEDDNEYLRTPYEKASHVVLSVVLKNGNPVGTFGLLNNSKGNAIKALVDLGVPVGVSTRGMGEEKRDNISAYIDETQYALITWDIVNNPNFSNLKMMQVTDSIVNNPVFEELKQAYQLRDSVCTAYRSDFLEKDMVAMISDLRDIFKKYNLV